MDSPSSNIWATIYPIFHHVTYTLIHVYIYIYTYVPSLSSPLYNCVVHEPHWYTQLTNLLGWFRFPAKTAASLAVSVSSLAAWCSAVVLFPGPIALPGAPPFLAAAAWNLGLFLQLRPWLLVIAGYFYGIIHSINGVSLVRITGKGP